MSFVILVVVVVVVDTLSWLMDWIFFINVHLHRFVIEKCPPNLIPNIVTLPRSPTPNNNIGGSMYMDGAYEWAQSSTFPLKSQYSHFIHTWFISLHLSCLIRALLLNRGLFIKNTLYRLSYSFSFFFLALMIFWYAFCLFYHIWQLVLLF